MEYKPSTALADYIAASELRVVNDNFRVRLSPALAKKYDAGAYKNAIASLAEYTDVINKLGIKYPGNAHPIFYVYVVPDDNFVELLSYPYNDRKGGGRPVSIYDLDGFNSAYGTSQNLLVDRKEHISRRVNGIHEFAHMVHGMFFNSGAMLNEGFAELLPLYTIGLESSFDEHRAVIKSLTDDKIFTARELLNMDASDYYHKNNVFGKSCSFNWAYLSSYLFVRGYVMRLAKKFGLSRVAATQKFLEIMRSVQTYQEFQIADLGVVIGMGWDEILNGKTLQMDAIREINEIDNAMVQIASKNIKNK